MADDGLFDFDRTVDLNKALDDGLMRHAMEVLDLDSRAGAITQSLHEAIAEREIDRDRVTDQEA